MIYDGIEIQETKLSYDKILKNTLAQSDELTIRFINGLLGDNIPLDAEVTWLDKETVNDKNKGIVADFYPKIDGKIYSIELEGDDRGNMAIRVFKYAVGGAILHGTKATNAELNISFPQPCVVFLRNTANTPRRLTWNIDFFDGQKVSLQVPTILLGEMSIEEIVRRDLFPIGQFYLRTFEPLTKNKVEAFKEAATKLLESMRDAAERGVIPKYLAPEMQKVVREIAENTVQKSELEVDLAMTTNIVETLPWVDYKEVFRQIEERGEAKGRAEGQMQIALNLFYRRGKDTSKTELANTLRELGVSDEIIHAAIKQYESEHVKQPKKRTSPER